MTVEKTRSQSWINKHHDPLSLLTLLSAGNPYGEESKPRMMAPKRRNISNGDLYGPIHCRRKFSNELLPLFSGKGDRPLSGSCHPRVPASSREWRKRLHPPSRHQFANTSAPFSILLRWIHVAVASRRQREGGERRHQKRGVFCFFFFIYRQSASTCSRLSIFRLSSY